MPRVNDYKCKICGFEMPFGWGGHIYAENDQGQRIVCPHPIERYYIREVLGENVYDPVKKDYKYRLRSGFNSHCLCLNCLNQFDLDVEKDDRKCPKCGSTEVHTELEMVGKKCPKCHKGTIEEKWTLAIS